MRDYIFGFKHRALLDFKISIKEALVLRYLLDFFDSGNAFSKRIENKTYYLIYNSKVVADLPILDVQERQVFNMIKSLEGKGVLKRYNNSTANTYIYIAREKIIDGEYDKCPFSNSDLNDIDIARNSSTKNIQLKYVPSKNFYKIFFSNHFNNKENLLDCGVSDTGEQTIGKKMVYYLTRTLRSKLNKLVFDVTIKDGYIEKEGINYIVLYVPCSSIINEKHSEIFKSAVFDALDKASKYWFFVFVMI